VSARKTLKVSDPRVQIEMWQRNNYSPGKDPSLYGQFDASYNSAVSFNKLNLYREGKWS
jgi:hypothetical protein